MKRFLVIAVIQAVCFIGEVYSHAALTFPPARALDLDFLDFFRTKGPCGMPKGRIRTTVKAGSMVNVTWHLAYPHRGGFRIELLDKDEKFMAKLTEPESNSSHITGDPTAQWYTVRIPDEACEDCTIRLLRLANEWKNYGYWSCADVTIVKDKDYKEDCFGRGEPKSDSMCECRKGFWGPRCQYKDDCADDSDCSGGNGKCVDIGGTSLPRKQCFCSAGFHGVHCELENKVKLPTPENLELSSYKKTSLTDRIQLYHKIIDSSSKDDSEIEMALVVNGTSYVAIGFRPSSLDQSCQEMPFIDEKAGLARKKRAAKSKPYRSNPTLLEPLQMSGKIRAEEPKSEPEVTSEPKAEPEGEPESETQPKAEPETVPESETQPKGEPETAPESETQPKGEPETAPESETQPKAEPETAPESETQPKAEPETVPESETQPKAEPETAPESETQPNAEPETEPESETQPNAEPESETQPKAEAEPEGASEPTSSPKTKREPESLAEPETAADESISAQVVAEPEPEYHGGQHMLDNPSPFKLEKRRTKYTPPKSDFHPMDCMDVIIGTARDMHSRILDYYTRDRATPRLDTFWGGTEDITSAVGWEKDGITTIIFRRKLKSTDPTDHTIDDGRMTVIFARGQEHGEYVHNPKSGLETENPSIPNFYTKDEIKYHGQSTQRGVRFINFME